jgi:hypothetical protein
MRGTTVKKINAFVDQLIINTPEDQLTKTRDELIRDVKVQWKKSGPLGQKFINSVVDGSFEQNP